MGNINDDSTTDPEQIAKNLNENRRPNFDEVTYGRVLVLDPKTGLLKMETPEEAQSQQVRNDTLPAQKGIGPWA